MTLVGRWGRAASCLLFLRLLGREHGWGSNTWKMYGQGASGAPSPLCAFQRGVSMARKSPLSGTPGTLGLSDFLDRAWKAAEADGGPLACWYTNLSAPSPEAAAFGSPIHPEPSRGCSGSFQVAVPTLNFVPCLFTAHLLPSPSRQASRTEQPGLRGEATALCLWCHSSGTTLGRV